MGSGRDLIPSLRQEGVFVCVFPQDQPQPIWIAAHNVQHLSAHQDDGLPIANGKGKEDLEEDACDRERDDLAFMIW